VQKVADQTKDWWPLQKKGRKKKKNLSTLRRDAGKRKREHRMVEWKRHEKCGGGGESLSRGKKGAWVRGL